MATVTCYTNTNRIIVNYIATHEVILHMAIARSYSYA